MAGYDNLNPAFASRLRSMIDAAAKEGVAIGIGSGFRTVDEQIALRRKNGCPDVWSSPASSCRVPTAIPGRSNHNVGLAADLTGDKGWANANAARFGLAFTVSGEDWHVEMAGDDGAAGGQTPIGFNANWATEQRNPQDELADRLHAVMRIVGSSTGPIDTPADMLDPTDVGTDTVTAAQQPTPTPTATGGDAGGLQAFARQQLQSFGWDESQMPALIELWNRESNWNPNAQNPTSTAYGIAQFLNGTWEGTGFKKTSDPNQQILAGLTYIKGRYGSPQAALNFHQQKNWY